jgi:Na+-driven multidrug efflux pump
MMLGTLLNLVLDPIFIFGYFGVPGMGIRGAAIATILAQAISVLWLWKLLTVKHELISLEKWNGAPFVQSVKNILRLGVPGVLSMILMPVSSAIITKIIGTYGHEAVAACGAAARIEMFAFVIPMALGISMMPFVSQNYGALRMDRIREGITLSTRFAMFYGCFIAVAFYVSAPLMSSFFTEDPVVSDILQSYIRIISFGYGMMEIHRYCGIIMTGLHLPMSSTLLNGFRVFVLLIPLSLLGSHFGGLKGVFFARLMTDLLGGFIGLIWVYRCYRAVAAKTPMPRGSFA